MAQPDVIRALRATRDLPYLPGIAQRYDLAHPSGLGIPSETVNHFKRVLTKSWSTTGERADATFAGPSAIFRNVTLGPTDPVVTLPFQFALPTDAKPPFAALLRQVTSQYHVNLYVEEKGSEFADQIKLSEAFARYALFKQVDQQLVTNTVANPERITSLNMLIDAPNMLGSSGPTSGNIVFDLNDLRWRVTAMDGEEEEYLIYIVNPRTMIAIDNALVAAGLNKEWIVVNGRRRRAFGGVPFVINGYIPVVGTGTTTMYCALMHPTYGVFFFVHEDCPEPVPIETVTELAPFNSYELMWNVEVISMMDRALARTTDVAV